MDRGQGTVIEGLPHLTSRRFPRFKRTRITLHDRASAAKDYINLLTLSRGLYLFPYHRREMIYIS